MDLSFSQYPHSFPPYKVPSTYGSGPQKSEGLQIGPFKKYETLVLGTQNCAMATAARMLKSSCSCVCYINPQNPLLTSLTRILCCFRILPLEMDMELGQSAENSRSSMFFIEIEAPPLSAPTTIHTQICHITRQGKLSIEG